MCQNWVGSDFVTHWVCGCVGSLRQKSRSARSKEKSKNEKNSWKSQLSWKWPNLREKGKISWKGLLSWKCPICREKHKNLEKSTFLKISNLARNFRGNNYKKKISLKIANFSFGVKIVKIGFGVKSVFGSKAFLGQNYFGVNVVFGSKSFFRSKPFIGSRSRWASYWQFQLSITE